MRIGQGFDAHSFASGRPLVLGGITIPHDQGLAAHSDGDVAIHALCDALLGAAALGDIGQQFPDSDATYANIDSRILLRKVVERLVELGFRIVNIDLTIIAQAPKLAPYIDQMRTTLAPDLRVQPEDVGIKATTTEGLGFTGRGEGIAASAVCLIEKI